MQRMGLLLGLMAWCMQLIIFVQPLLPGATMPGLGVCQSVVDVFSQHDLHIKSMSNHDNIHKNQLYIKNNLQNFEHAHITPQHDLTTLHHSLATVDHALSQPLPTPVNHHSSHMSCGFCTLYGHAIPPPTLMPVWFVITKRLFVTLSAFSRLPLMVVVADYIKPQSRAPPLLFRFNLYY